MSRIRLTHLNGTNRRAEMQPLGPKVRTLGVSPLITTCPEDAWPRHEIDATRAARTRSTRYAWSKDLVLATTRRSRSDVTPSLLSRLRNGYKPDAEGFMTLVRLAQNARGTFPGGRGFRDAPSSHELMAELAPLLRARKDLDETDVEMLQEVIAATLKRAVNAKRGERE